MGWWCDTVITRTETSGMANKYPRRKKSYVAGGRAEMGKRSAKGVRIWVLVYSCDVTVQLSIATVGGVTNELAEKLGHWGLQSETSGVCSKQCETLEACGDDALEEDLDGLLASRDVDRENGASRVRLVLRRGVGRERRVGREADRERGAERGGRGAEQLDDHRLATELERRGAVAVRHGDRRVRVHAPGQSLFSVRPKPPQGERMRTTGYPEWAHRPRPGAVPASGR